MNKKKKNTKDDSKPQLEIDLEELGVFQVFVLDDLFSSDGDFLESFACKTTSESDSLKL